MASIMLFLLLLSKAPHCRGAPVSCLRFTRKKKQPLTSGGRLLLNEDPDLTRAEGASIHELLRRALLEHRVAAKGNSRKPNFRFAGFSATQLLMGGLLGNRFAIHE